VFRGDTSVVTTWRVQTWTKGTVKWFNPTQDMASSNRRVVGKDVFVHISGRRTGGFEHAQ